MNKVADTKDEVCKQVENGRQPSNIIILSTVVASTRLRHSFLKLINGSSWFEIPRINFITEAGILRAICAVCLIEALTQLPFHLSVYVDRIPSGG